MGDACSIPLLEWSRMQMGELKFKPENIAFQGLLNNTVDLLRGQAVNKQITIEIFSDVAQVYADSNMLVTILRNLISNAIKFTPGSGTVTVKAVEDSQHVEISVIDTGIGMSREIQGRLFNLRETITGAGTEGEKGTGLGLLLCKEFIEKHQG